MGEVTLQLTALGGLVGLGFLLFLFVVILVAVVTVLAILVLRVALLWFLAILSPIIFLFAVLPFTRGLTSTWWNYFIRYTFMGAMVALILRIAFDISKVPTGSQGFGTDMLANSFIKILLVISLLFMAGLIPMLLGDKLASAVAGKIGDWTKGFKKSSLARTPGGAALAYRRKMAEQKAFRRAGDRYARGVGIPFTGKGLGTAIREGMAKDKKWARLANKYTFGYGEGKFEAMAQTAADYEKAIEAMPKEMRYNILQSQNKRRTRPALALAAARQLVDSGLLNDDQLAKYKGVEDEVGYWLAQGDSKLIPAVKGSQPYLYLNPTFFKANRGKAMGLLKSAMRSNAKGMAGWERHSFGRVFSDLEKLRDSNTITGQEFQKYTGDIINTLEPGIIAQALTVAESNNKIKQALTQDIDLGRNEGGIYHGTPYANVNLRSKLQQYAQYAEPGKAANITRIIDEYEKAVREIPGASGETILRRIERNTGISSGYTGEGQSDYTNYPPQNR